MIRMGDEKAWAIFDRWPDPIYRYELGRAWDYSLPRLVSAMLNPSDADHLGPDPTLTRNVGFASGFGYGSLVVVNAYAWIDSKPRALPRLDGRPSSRAVGPENNEAVIAAITGHDVIAAWGKHCTRERADWMLRVGLAGAKRVDCLGTNKDGSPKHPLYLAASTQRIPFGVGRRMLDQGGE